MSFFFDAKMYVVSYSIIVAFQSYDQSYNSLMSLAPFFVLDFNFFNDPEIYKKNTLKQLEAAALSVKQKEKKYRSRRNVFDRIKIYC